MSARPEAIAKAAASPVPARVLPAESSSSSSPPPPPPPLQVMVFSALMLMLTPGVRAVQAAPDASVGVQIVTLPEHISQLPKPTAETISSPMESRYVLQLLLVQDALKVIESPSQPPQLQVGALFPLCWTDEDMQHVGQLPVSAQQPEVASGVDPSLHFAVPAACCRSRAKKEQRMMCIMVV